MRNKKVRLKYCKYCGSLIDNNTNICTKCNKHYFKFKPIYIINILMGFLIVFLLVECIKLYYDYQAALKDKVYCNNSNKYENNSNKYETQSDVDWRENARRILDRYNNSSNNQTDTDNPSNTDVSLNKDIEDDIDFSFEEIEDEPSENTVYYNTYTQSSEPICDIPGCDKQTQSNSYYCYNHECMKVECHEKRANDFCFYCIEHKCIAPNCNSGRAYNSYYCNIHK